MTSEQIINLRRRLHAELDAEIAAEDAQRPTYTPPRYDEVFWRGAAWMAENERSPDEWGAEE